MQRQNAQARLVQGFHDKTRWLSGSALVCAASCLLMAGAIADDGPPPVGDDNPQAHRGTVSLILENDTVADQDRAYTGGIGVTYTSGANQVPEWSMSLARFLPFFSEEGELRYALGVGQSVFTPEDLSRKVPDPDDRPYAGWLYGSAALMSKVDRSLETVELTLGLIGPGALGEQAQSFAHEVLGDGDPEGWDSQLDDELALTLSYEKRWLNVVTFSENWGFDFQPHIDLTAGNVFTYAGAGLTLRFGSHLQSDYGVRRVRPGVNAASYRTTFDGFRWNAFAGIEARAVAQNIFLDGNTFTDSASIDKKDFVYDVSAGLMMQVNNISLGYSMVYRSKEFDGQDEEDIFGSLNLSILL